PCSVCFAVPAPLSPVRYALSLHDALPICARGRIFDAKRDYRRAVDETLFGLGERRYDALVDLLVQLRQPQLSKRPNERALSDALDRKSTRLNSSHVSISYAVFCLKKKQKT